MVSFLSVLQQARRQVGPITCAVGYIYPIPHSLFNLVQCNLAISLPSTLLSVSFTIDPTARRYQEGVSPFNCRKLDHPDLFAAFGIQDLLSRLWSCSSHLCSLGYPILGCYINGTSKFWRAKSSCIPVTLSRSGMAHILGIRLSDTVIRFATMQQPDSHE